MNFDERHRSGQQRIAQRNAGVGEGAGIEQDAGRAVVARGVDALDQLVLGVALEMVEGVTRVGGHLLEPGDDVRQRLVAVAFRFARAEQVQVGSIQ